MSRQLLCLAEKGGPLFTSAKRSTLTASLILAAFVVVYPLTANPIFAPVFVGPKLVFLRITAVALAVLSARWFLGGRQAAARGGANILFSGFFLIFTLTAITSIDRTASIFGQYGRWEGWLTVAAYMMLAYVGANLIDPRGSKLIGRAAAVSLLSVSVLTIGEIVLGNPFLALAKVYCPSGYAAARLPLGDARPLAGFGGPNDLGAFLAMMWPLAIAIRPERARSRALMTAAAVGVFPALALTQSRSAWLAGAAVLLIVAVKGLRGRDRRVLFTAAAGMLLGAAAIFLTAGLRSRALSLFNISEALAARPLIWKSTLAAIADRPLLGWGPQTLKLVFPRYKPAGWLASYDSAPVDQAHNLFLDQAVSSGVFAALLVLILAVFLIKRLWRARIRQGDEISFGAGAGALSYLIYAQFQPTNPAVTPFFWLLVGLSFSRRSETEPLLAARPQEPKVVFNYRRLVDFGAVLATAALSLLLLQPYLAEISFNRAFDARQSGDLYAGASLARTARERFSWEPRYWLAEGEAYLLLAADGGDRQLAEEAGFVLDRSLSLASRDAAVHFRTAAAWLDWGRASGDRAALARAVNLAKRGLSLNPDVIDAYLDIGVAQARLGRLREAVAAWEEAVRVDEGDGRAWLNLGWAYEKQKKMADSRRAFARARQLGAQ